LSSISTTFARPLWPATTRTEPLGTSRAEESTSTSASFARPRSGGAATRTFQPSPCRPTSSVRAAPGETVTLIRAREDSRELFEDGDVVVSGLLGVRDRERPLLLAAGRREDNKWSRGSYSYWKVGQYTRFAGIERVPEGNCFFCGEHTSIDSQGYLNGAVETGERVAGEVLDSLG
jgi:hypothetical protein